MTTYVSFAVNPGVECRTIFNDMFAPKWARGPHNLARFPSWDPCITPGYWAWYLNALPTSGSLIRSLFYAFMPREGIYTCVFCPPSSPQRRKPGYAALLRIRGNYFRPYLSIPRVCHRGAAYQWKFSYFWRLSVIKWKFSARVSENTNFCIN